MTETKTLFERAQDTIAAKQQWSAGESVTIWQGKSSSASIVEGGRDGGGLLYLVLSSKSMRSACIAGQLSMTGWFFRLSNQEYKSWVAKVRKAS